MNGAYNAEFEMFLDDCYVYVTGCIEWSGPDGQDVEYTFDCQAVEPGTDMYQEGYMNALPIGWGKTLKDRLRDSMEAAYEAHAESRY